ncbi:MAG: thioredoxin-dependent thiol peroxidase [Ferruginibacter sp.]
MLKVGDTIPPVTVLDENGKPFSTTSIRGKWVLYFYPQDMTETCTVQACNLRDNFDELAKKRIAVVGISPDGIASHQKFKSKHTLPYSLLSDPDHKIINAFGVWGEKQMFGRKYLGLLRTTFLIEKGIIKKIITKPKSAQHAKEIFEAWNIT